LQEEAVLMTESNITHPSLLVRIRNTDDECAWGEFVEIYSPLIYGFSRKQGLQDADAVDVTQEVLRSVARSIGRLDYDPRRGSFRGWLFTIVRNELKDWFGRQRSDVVGSGDSSAVCRFEDLPALESEDSACWDQEHQRRLFEWASKRIQTEVQKSTWSAFWETTVKGRSGKEVAAELGLSVAAVYLAKSRVMARLKELVQVIL
jgi:RNA polymerase sigma factor (sigma-70 family)